MGEIGLERCCDDLRGDGGGVRVDGRAAGQMRRGRSQVGDGFEKCTKGRSRCRVE